MHSVWHQKRLTFNETKMREVPVERLFAVVSECCEIVQCLEILLK